MKLAIKDIDFRLFVRKELDQDRILTLAELIESGVTLDPILVNRQNVGIDGRHRVAAHTLMDMSEIEVKVVDVTDEAEIIAMAYNSNTGGSLPPKQEDTEHTVMMLLSRGVTKKRIGEMLGLKAPLARRYIAEVESKAARKQIMKAAAAVTDGGLTLGKAAEQYQVDPEKLKEVLSGHRKKHKAGFPEMQRNVTWQFKSMSSKTAALFRKLFEKHEDGDVTPGQVLEIIEHVKSLQRKASRAVADWEKRFEALHAGDEKVAKEPRSVKDEAAA